MKTQWKTNDLTDIVSWAKSDINPGVAIRLSDKNIWCNHIIWFNQPFLVFYGDLLRIFVI